MSEDATDRMDRAKRIRRMREGQRESSVAGGDEESTEEATDDAGDSSTATDTAGVQGPADPVDARENSAATMRSQREDQATDATQTSSPVADVDQSVADDDQGSEDDGRDSEEEASAAARRAAQSAAQIHGNGTTDATTNVTTAEVSSIEGTTESEQSPVDAPATATTQGSTGIELPGQASVQAAIADEVLDADGVNGRETPRTADAGKTATSEETARVLEFTLGDERYCLDVMLVEEIVERDAITRVPNTPDYVEGIVDLRGQITTILDTKRLLDIDGEGPESLLVVFDPDEFEDQGAIGWIVDDVRRVAPVAESAINDPPVDERYIEAIVDREEDDEFVIWTDPEVAMGVVTGDGDEEAT